MNKNAGKRLFKKCHKQQKQLCVYLLLVASWACGVTAILTQRMLPQCFFVWGFHQSIHLAISDVYDTFLEIIFYPNPSFVL